MNLLLDRAYKCPTYTIGRLYIDGIRFCDTLEDTVRDLTTTKKVNGKTAIPAGHYEVSMNIISPKYSKKNAFKWCGGRMPRLLNVPNFEGILIHTGNTPEDTEGCILVGLNKVKGGLTDSTTTFRRLWERLNEAYRRHERIEIDIRNS